MHIYEIQAFTILCFRSTSLEIPAVLRRERQPLDEGVQNPLLETVSRQLTVTICIINYLPCLKKGYNRSISFKILI